jgi:hypothetical protein
MLRPEWRACRSPIVKNKHQGQTHERRADNWPPPAPSVHVDSEHV